MAKEEVDMLIGQLLVGFKKISEQDVGRILAYAAKKGWKFGESAIKLGLISRQDLDHALAAQFDYPYLDKGVSGLSNKLVAAFEPFSVKGNALRILRAQLQQHWFSEGHQALCLVGAGGREGCSYIAANLAVIFSQLGRNTVLVDADVKDPTQHKLFNIGNDVGLSAALVGRVDIESVATRLPLFRNLSLVPAGIAPPNAYDLLRRAELPRIIDKLSARYDVVLFDAPSYDANLGIENLTAQCGGALLVIRKHYTRLVESRELLTAMRERGTTIVGSVINQY